MAEPLPGHHHDLALLALAASFEPGLSALNSSISRVPLRQASAMPSQNDCDPSALEILDADALLFDPGVIAEVEYLASRLIRQFHHIVIRSRSGRSRKPRPH